jgi:RNA recognition motif-containing protein
MGKRLFVGNLAYAVTEQSLKDLFGGAGSVQSVKIITDRDTGRSKGFAFVEMATDDEAAKAIEQFNSADLQGRAMQVSEAKPRPEGDGGGGPRRFGGGGGRF